MSPPPHRDPSVKGSLRHERSPAMVRASSWEHRREPEDAHRDHELAGALRRCGNQHLGSVTLLHGSVVVQAECEDRTPNFRISGNPHPRADPGGRRHALAGPGPDQPGAARPGRLLPQVAAWRTIIASAMPI